MPARTRILRAAMDLFHAQGVHATSPRQIMEASQTGQGQLYHYFGSKAGLVEAVLDAHVLMATRGEGPVDHAFTSWDDVDTWFDAWAGLCERFHMERGCPLAAVARDVTRTSDALRDAAVRPFEAINARMRPFFQAEIDAGRLDVPSAEGLARWCMAQMQGAVLLGQLHRSAEPLHDVFGHAKAYLRMLRGAAG